MLILVENLPDNHLFEIMERKYRVSLEINSVIKESSLDCITTYKR